MSRYDEIERRGAERQHQLLGEAHARRRLGALERQPEAPAPRPTIRIVIQMIRTLARLLPA